MNTHRTFKSDCKRLNEHFLEVCPGALFSVQVLEKLPGDGYVNGKVDYVMMRDRRQREQEWIKKLCTAYPYGLNTDVDGSKDVLSVRQLFPMLPRYGTRYIESRTRNNQPEQPHIQNLEALFLSLEEVPLKERDNLLRKNLEKGKKSKLKNLAQQARVKLR